MASKFRWPANGQTYVAASLKRIEKRMKIDERSGVRAIAKYFAGHAGGVHGSGELCNYAAKDKRCLRFAIVH